MIWQTKILSATRPKSNRPRSKQRPHPSQKKPRPLAAHPSSRSPVAHRRAARPALRRRPIRPSRPNPRPSRAAAMTPRPRPDKRPPRRVRPASPNRAAGPPMHAPDRRRVASPGPGQPANGPQGDRRPAQQGRPTRATRPTTSASSIRQPPTPSPVAAAGLWVPAAALPAEGPVAAAGTITVAAAPRGSSRGLGLPAASQRQQRPAEQRPSSGSSDLRRKHIRRRLPCAASERPRVGQAAITSRTANNRTQDHAAVDLPTAPAWIPSARPGNHGRAGRCGCACGRH